MGRIAYDLTIAVGSKEGRFAEFCHYVLLCYPYHSPLVREGDTVRLTIELDRWTQKTTDWFNRYRAMRAIGHWSVKERAMHIQEETRTLDNS